MPTESVRTAVVQMEVLPGRPVDNAARMLRDLEAARAQGATLVVFPEMAIPGYLIADEWEHESFLRECETCAEEVRQASANLTVVFGSVGVDWTRRNEDGRVRKYNAAFVAHHGRFLGPLNSLYPFVIKTLLPNYREFDDSRHFYDLRKLALEMGMPVSELVTPVVADELALGIVLCEDAWNLDYSLSPLDLLAQHHPADLYINISASPFTLNKNQKRHRVFSVHAARLRRPLVYCNHTGIQNNGKTVYTFDGSSCIYDSHGHHVPCGSAFADAVTVQDIPLAPSACFGTPIDLQGDGIAQLCAALLYGTRRFLDLCGVQRVAVGLSGGIDSAVVAALYSRLLPPERLLAVNLPSRFNSRTTRDLARTLAGNLGCLFAEIPIETSVGHTIGQLDGLALATADGQHAQRLALSGLVRENIQARDRGARLLAALAAAFGGVFTCNANKSELTVGYTTLYGDLGGYLASIGDLWKQEVYALARHLNAQVFGREVIPAGSLTVTPSAELSSDQNVDAGQGDPLCYPYHDCLFGSWVEEWNRTSPEEILAAYADGRLEERIGYRGTIAELFPTPAAFIADLERWWNLYTGMGVAKRIQAPPVLAVKRRAFGFDHRESQLGPRYTRAYAALKAGLLQSSPGP